MSLFKRLLLFVVLVVPLTIVFIGLQTHTTYATQDMPTGSGGETVSDDAQLFGNRVGDVLNQAQPMNNAVQADTRVVKVSQMTLGIRSELTSGNYAQGTIDVMQQVQSKLSPNYTWIWVTIAILVVHIVAGVLGFTFVRRRQNVAVEANAREQAMTTKQAAVDLVTSLGKKSKDLAPRVEVLLALVPTTTANSLRALFQTAQGQQGRIEEHLGNLLSSLDARPNGNGPQIDYYKRMQLNYQQVYNEARAPQNLLQAVETAVTTLEQNPQAQINFRQLTMLDATQEGIAQ